MKSYFIIIQSVIFFAMNGQNLNQLANVSGTVFNKENQVLEFANVILFTTADSSMVKGTATNSEGFFKLEQIKDGSYWLSVQYVGLKNVDSPIFEIKNGESKKDISIHFDETPLELSAVEVVASRPLIEVKPDKIVFNVDGSINATGSTAFELLRKSPGVVVDNSDNILLSGKQGVVIYIDGKPTYISGDELVSYLKSIQSSEIDFIEIIDEPSAKYDAEGNAGIINIKMKKNTSLGTNINSNIGYSYRENHRYNGGININYRNKNSNVYGNFNYKNYKNNRWFDFLTYQSGQVFDSDDTIFNHNKIYNYKTGIDYFINKNNTIGLLVSGNTNDDKVEINTITNISNAVNASLEEILISSSLKNREINNFNSNLNYKYKNESNTIVNIDLDYGNFKLASNDKQFNTYQTPSQVFLNESNYTSDGSTDINIYTFKIDYEKELFDGKLGTGVKSSYVTTENIYNIYKLFEEMPKLDKDRSSIFNFEENINAAYVNYSRNIESLNLSFVTGLRFEQTNNVSTQINQVNTEDNIIKRNYVNAFPTFSITYNNKGNNQFKINYNKRIKRPRYQDLNPFEFIVSELSFVKGNINLQPQYAHNFGMTHTYKNRLTTKISYSRINKYFDYLRDTVDVNKSVMQPVNLENQQVINLGISYPFSPKNWWNTFTNLNAFHKKNNANFGENRQIDLTANSLSIYHQSTFLLPFDISIEVSGYYNSPAIWGALYQTNSNYSINTGLKKRLFKGKGNLKIAFTDVFNTSPWSAIQEFSGTKIEANGGWESQQIKLNFTYLFGNEQVKDIRKRKTGLESEAERAK